MCDRISSTGNSTSLPCPPEMDISSAEALYSMVCAAQRDIEKADAAASQTEQEIGAIQRAVSEQNEECRAQIERHAALQKQLLEQQNRLSLFTVKAQGCARLLQATQEDVEVVKRDMRALSECLLPPLDKEELQVRCHYTTTPSHLISLLADLHAKLRHATELLDDVKDSNNNNSTANEAVEALDATDTEELSTRPRLKRRSIVFHDAATLERVTIVPGENISRALHPCWELLSNPSSETGANEGGDQGKTIVSPTLGGTPNPLQNYEEDAAAAVRRRVESDAAAVTPVRAPMEVIRQPRTRHGPHKTTWTYSRLD